MPRATSIWEKRVSSAATRMSQASAISMPSVRHHPCSAQTTGVPRCAVWKPRQSTPPSGIPPSPCCSASPTWTRSRPPVKWSPWANSTPQRTSSSRSSSPKASASWSRMSRSKALRLGTRLSPMSSRCPTRCRVTLRGSSVRSNTPICSGPCLRGGLRGGLRRGGGLRQPPLVDLPDRGARQLVAELHDAGDLERGEVLAAAGDHLVGRDPGARCRDDDSLDRLAAVGVRDADDGDRRDPLDGADDALDLGRVHVVAARDDHLLAPAHDGDEPVLVDAGQVAGEQPA